MNKATVAFDLQPCIGNRSGIGMYTYELAKRMKDTECLSFSGNVFDFCNRMDTSKYLDGIKMPVRKSTAVPGKIFRHMPKVFTIPYEWIFSVADLSVFFNYIVPKKIKGKVIVFVHDMVCMRFPDTMSGKNLLNLRMNLVRGVERADRVITISEFSKREIHELLHVPLEKISIIYPAASVSKDILEKEILCVKFGIEKPYILFVGNIEPRKNLIRVLQAFESLKKKRGIPHQLILAGGEGWRNEKIYETIREMSSKIDIIFTGYVSEIEKNTLYQYAEMFVFPSLYEGFGIPPLEAMYFGCPVVCSNVASLPEVCGDAAAMVDPYDVESIADGMWKIISDERYRSDLIRKGYQQEKMFSYEASAQKLAEVCWDILTTQDNSV